MRQTPARLLFHALRASRPAPPPRASSSSCNTASPRLLRARHALYAALKEAHPGCTLIVATRGLGHATLLHDPHIDHLIETPDPGRSLRSLHRRALELRDKLRALNLHPTHILQDASNRRGTLALFAALLRLAPTTGLANQPELYDTHLIYDPRLSLIDNNLRLVAPQSETAAPHREPAVYFTIKDLTTAQSLLRTSAQPLTAIVVQGSGAQPNSWHDDRFVTLIRHVESLGHRVVFLGTAAEAPDIDRIRALAGTRAESLAGRTSIPQLAALLCLCDTLITVDTGTLHVGRAAQVPMLVLAPTWQPAIEWLPLTVPNAIVLRGTDISSIPANYRLDEITTDSAIAAFTQLTHNFPPDASAREHRIARLLSHTRA